MSNCLVCGHTNVLGTLFCDECGNELTCAAPARHGATDGMAAAPAMAGAAAGRRPGGVTTGVTAAAASSVVPAGPDEIDAEGSQAPTWNAAPRDGGAAQPSSAGAGRPAEAAGAITAVYLVSDLGRRIDVPAQDVVIVGREDMRSGIRPDVDLTLDGASTAGISRRHCRLLHQPEGWYVEDLMSTNYSVLNGTPLQAYVPMRVIHGDELRLGKLRLRFYET